MSIFTKSKIILWPKKDTVEIYLGQKDNNSFSFNLNLWEDRSPTELLTLIEFFKSQGNQIFCCIPDDVIITKSFVYDSRIENIDKKEIKALAENSITFNIDPDYIDFELDYSVPEKTIIRAKITNVEKFKQLEQNLAKIVVTVLQYETVSKLITRVISSYYPEDYFVIYQPNNLESYLILAKGQTVYLTSRLKGTAPDLQKSINYSPLYFQKTTTKLYVPTGVNPELKSTTKMEITPYQPSQIAATLNQPVNLPLPVLGFVFSNVIIKDNQVKKPMESKKNILPIILVFVVTAAIASVVLYMITRHSANQPIETPAAVVTPEPVVEILPTEMPTPTLAPVSKKLKIQVLNATDINGQAAKVKSELTTLGFTSVTVGNSTERLTKNEIRLKAASSTSAPYFQQNLATFADANITDLKDTSTYDVVVVIGTDLSSGTPSSSASSSAEDTTATPTVKAKATATPTIEP